MKIGIYSKYIINPAGTTQLRCLHPKEYLENLGYNVRVRTIYRSLPRKNELVILHRCAADIHTENFIKYAKTLGNVILFDTDDLIFTKEGEEYLVKIGKKKFTADWNDYVTVIKQCDAFLASTRFIQKKALKIHRKALHVKNGLNNNFLQKADGIYAQRRSVKKKCITIGYLSGSKSHDRDFKIIEQPLLNILHTHSNVNVLVVGPLNCSEEFNVYHNQFEHREFIPYKDFVKVFAEIDINLIPLETQEEFCQGKSELKYFEAGVCGVMSVASPTEVHLDVIKEGYNGLIAKDYEWEEKLNALITDKNKIVLFGDNARKEVLKYYSPDVIQKIWNKVVSDFSLDKHNNKVEVKFGSRVKLLFVLLQMMVHKWIKRKIVSRIR